MNIYKRIDTRTRENLVLEIVVDEYIKTVTPVSSAYIAKECHLDLSSATIRNILSDLEDQGYLSHPHTSAGKVPTQEGYRYYVDHLMHEIQLLDEERQRIKEEYLSEVKGLEELLDLASKALSEVTHYTSIISIDGWSGKLICKGINFIVDYPEYQDFKKISDILEALEQKERLLEVINRDLEQKIKIYIGKEMAYENIESCSLAVSEFKTEHGPSGKLAILGPTRMDYKRVISTLDYFSQLMNEIL